jgi:DNA-binding CsgD family transcriptional regulator
MEVAAMAHQNPTVVLVLGAFAESASRSPWSEEPLAHDLDAVAVASPARPLTDDAADVRPVTTGDNGSAISQDAYHGQFAAHLHAAQATLIAVTSTAGNRSGPLGWTAHGITLQRAGLPGTCEVEGASLALSAAGAQQLAARFAGLHDAAVRGDNEIMGASHYVSAVAHNTAGHYAEALLDARRAVAHQGDALVDWALAELIEAAVRTGRFDEARSAHERLEARARAVGTDLALGIHARSAAMIAEGADAETRYLEAIERLGRGGADALLARTHLVYGEWLRRQQRRVESRAQLRRAVELFVAVGAQDLAERAGRELRATGETSQPRYTERLTPQESEVARLAAQCRTNREIGELLYISARTVEYHLGKVFMKLGVTSRRQLRDPALLAASSWQATRETAAIRDSQPTADGLHVPAPSLMCCKATECTA